MKTRDRIVLFVQDFIKHNGYSPTVREIGDAVGLKSSSTVHGHLKRLESMGLIRLEDRKPRTSRVGSRVSVLEEAEDVPSLIEWEGRLYKLAE